MSTTYRLLEIAEEVETTAAELYRALAVRFAGHPACDAFVRLAGEEEQHAARIRLVAAQYRLDRKLFAGAPRLEEGTAAAEALLASFAATLREVKDGGWCDDLGAVLDRLVGFEDRAAVLHAEELAAGAHPSVRGFLEQLARQDRAHQRLLAELRRAA